MADKNKDKKDQAKGNTTENSGDLTGAPKVSSENLDPNKSVSNFSPTEGVSVEGGVPGVDAGVTNADATGVVDEDLAKAANQRSKTATGSQTDKLTAIQQQMQGTGRKDIAEPRGDVKVGDTTVDFSGQPTEDSEPNRQGKTKIESADGRTLEVSVNSESYTGKEIWVPSEQEGEIRRILADGGYFTK